MATATMPHMKQVAHPGLSVTLAGTGIMLVIGAVLTHFIAEGASPQR